MLRCCISGEPNLVKSFRNWQSRLSFEENKIAHLLFPAVIQYPSSDKNRELYEVTKKLLEVMAMGQILPPPFSYLHTVIDHFDPPEVALVLKECIWNYMKENVPSPVIYNIDSNGK